MLWLKINLSWEKLSWVNLLWVNLTCNSISTKCCVDWISFPPTQTQFIFVVALPRCRRFPWKGSGESVQVGYRLRESLRRFATPGNQGPEDQGFQSNLAESLRDHYAREKKELSLQSVHLSWMFMWYRARIKTIVFTFNITCNMGPWYFCWSLFLLVVKEGKLFMQYTPALKKDYTN